jgi:hypothetical protein
LHRSAASLSTEHLSSSLRLRGRGFNLLSLVVSRLGILAGRNRFLVLDLLAFIVVIDAIAGAAGDLHASVAGGLEAVIADQRADASLLALDRVKGVEACELGVELRSGIFVEQRQRALR